MALGQAPTCRSSPPRIARELDIAAQQGGQFYDLTDIPKLPQEILVCVQFVRIPGDQALGPAERERGYSGFIAITASPRCPKKYG